jgi:hypothetical protein
MKPASNPWEPGGSYAPPIERSASSSQRSSPLPPDKGVPPTPVATPEPLPDRNVGQSDLAHPFGNDATRSLIPSGRFGRATGRGLKLRFLLALTLIALAPASLLVVIYQQANSSAVEHAGQMVLQSTAQANSHALRQELANYQAYLTRLARQTSINQISHGSPSANNLKQAEEQLNEASLSTESPIAWMLLNENDQIIASTPSSIEGQTLTKSTVMASADQLETFVHTLRSAPPPAPNQSSLTITSGQDSSLPNKTWAAMLAFISPTTPTQSGAILAIFSLPEIANNSLSTFSSSSTSYVMLVDPTGTVLGVVGNQQMAKQVGQPITTTPLHNAQQRLLQGEDLSITPQIYDDPITGKQEEVAGALIPELKWGILVVASPNAVAPAVPVLLSDQNVPLILLCIVVVTTLIATWVAIPIVRPIRRASREILGSTDDVRLLAEQAKQISKDQQLGTDIMKGAAKGLDMRRRAIRRDASMIVNSTSTAAGRLTQLTQALSGTPDHFQRQLQQLMWELHQDLQTSYQLAANIASSLENDPAQRHLGNVLEGAAEISQQFDLASQQLQQGVNRLERAAEALQ